jgi:hypothetical protein
MSEPDDALFAAGAGLGDATALAGFPSFNRRLDASKLPSLAALSYHKRAKPGSGMTPTMRRRAKTLGS